MDTAIRATYATEPTERAAALRPLIEAYRRADAAALTAEDRKALIADLVRIGALNEAYAVAHESIAAFQRQGVVGVRWGMLWQPGMRAFRSDARFQGFVERLRLIDYWQQYGAPEGCTLSVGVISCE